MPKQDDEQGLAVGGRVWNPSDGAAAPPAPKETSYLLICGSLVLLVLVIVIPTSIIASMLFPDW